MWERITARFSKITIGFTLVGLVFGLCMVTTSLLYANGGESTRETLSQMFTFELILCPPSLGLMALDGPESWFTTTFALTCMVLENVILYWIVGVICNRIWKLVTRAPASTKL